VTSDTESYDSTVIYGCSVGFTNTVTYTCGQDGSFAIDRVSTNPTASTEYGGGWNYANEFGKSSSDINDLTEIMVGEYILYGCEACAAGTYKSQDGATICTDCPAGRYIEETGSDDATDCIDCAAGRYIDTSGSDEMSDCIECPTGKYRPEWNMTWNMVEGRSFRWYNMISDGILNDKSVEECQAACLERDACRGFSRKIDPPGEGTVTCVMFKNTELEPPHVPSIELSLYQLLPDSGCAVSQKEACCQQQNDGKQPDETMMAQCVSEGCAYNGDSCGIASPAYWDCTAQCDATRCTVCAAGKYNNVSGSEQEAACIDCKAGTYINVTGSDEAADCIDCAAGKYSRMPLGPCDITCVGKTFDDGALAAHPVCWAEEGIGYWQHTSYASNMVTRTGILLRGTLSSFFPNEGQRITKSECIKRCSALAVLAGECVGVSYAGGICTYYSQVTGTTLMGTVVSAILRLLTGACGLGAPFVNLANDDCSLDLKDWRNCCDHGTCNGGPLTGCLDCVAGRYLSVQGSSEAGDCINCVAGKYLGVAGSVAADQCIECDVGKYVKASGSNQHSDCIDCSTGRYFDTPGSAADCIECQPGMYADLTGRRTCSTCAEGKYVDTTGNIAASNCTGCPAGQVVHARAAQAGTAGAARGGGCIACPASKYSTGITTAPPMVSLTALVGEEKSKKWNGGVLGHNGKIYGIPFQAKELLMIDTEANGTLTYTPNTY
jgi:hypothetical protein